MIGSLTANYANTLRVAPRAPGRQHRDARRIAPRSQQLLASSEMPRFSADSCQTRGELLQAAFSFLNGRSPYPTAASEIAVSRALGIQRWQLVLHPNEGLQAGVIPQSLEGELESLAQGYPFPYLQGTHTFYGFNIHARPGVFIPRPKSALVLHLARKILELRGGNGTLLDIFCGSGSLGSILASFHRPLRAVCLDSSPSAISLAQENVNLRESQVRDRVTLLCGNGFQTQGLQPGGYQMIVSVPPNELLYPATPFEDSTLCGKAGDGLHFLRMQLAEASRFLSADGVLVSEIAGDHEGVARELLTGNGYWKDFRILAEPVEDGRNPHRVLIATAQENFPWEKIAFKPQPPFYKEICRQRADAASRLLLFATIQQLAKYPELIGDRAQPEAQLKALAERYLQISFAEKVKTRDLPALADVLRLHLQYMQLLETAEITLPHLKTLQLQAFEYNEAPILDWVAFLVAAEMIKDKRGWLNTNKRLVKAHLPPDVRDILNIGDLETILEQAALLYEVGLTKMVGIVNAFGVSESHDLENGPRRLAMAMAGHRGPLEKWVRGYRALQPLVPTETPDAPTSQAT